MEITIDITKRIEWLKKRISMNETEEGYIRLQMRSAIKEAVNLVSENNIIPPVINSTCECCNENEAKIKVNICHSCDEYKLHSSD